MAKNDVKVGIKDSTSTETISDIESFNKVVEKGSVAEEPVAPAIVASIVDYPVTIKYGDSSIRISGRDRTTVGDFSKLPNPLPKGLVAKKL